MKLQMETLKKIIKEELYLELRGLDDFIMGTNDSNAPFNQTDWVEEYGPIVDECEWITDDMLDDDNTYTILGNDIGKIFEKYMEKYPNDPWDKNYKFNLMKKHAKEMAEELKQLYLSKSQKTESIFDNSIYHKPENQKRIGWIVINKTKNDGRPLYKLYDSDDKSWGATCRMGTGKYPEDHSLFYTVPIKIEDNRKFRIMIDDNKWSRPYSYDDYQIEKGVFESKDFRTEQKEVFRKYHPEKAIWFQNNNELFGSVTLVNNKYYYLVCDKFGSNKQEGSESTLELAKQKVLNILGNKK